jgi:fused signal recognition particle receptor
MLRKLLGALTSVFRGRQLDENLLLDLEEALILSDVGMDTTELLMADLRAAIHKQRLRQADQVKEALKQRVVELLGEETQPLRVSDEKPTVWMFIGVNGTGKTTTIAKVAYRLRRQRQQVLMAAGDTFRAAAQEQLGVWAKRVDCQLVQHQSGADPAAVIFDSLQAAKARGLDTVLVDTAGRLHTKHNLMEELKKVYRVVQRELGRAPDESLLVLDASTGQNGISQAATFGAAVPVTGIVLTKLDGSAKGGIVLAIASQLKVPIRLVGVGERMEDLEDFDPKQFAEGLFED